MRVATDEAQGRVGHGTLDLRPGVAAEEINAVNVRLPVHRADEDDDRTGRPLAGCIGELLEVNASRYDADALGCGHRGHLAVVLLGDGDDVMKAVDRAALVARHLRG